MEARPCMLVIYADFLLVDKHSCQFYHEATVPWPGLGFSATLFPSLQPSPSQSGAILFALKASNLGWLVASCNPSNPLIRRLKGWSIFNTMIDNGFYLTHLLL